MAHGVVIGAGSKGDDDFRLGLANEEADVPAGHGLPELHRGPELYFFGEVGVGVLPDNDDDGEAVLN